MICETEYMEFEVNLQGLLKFQRKLDGLNVVSFLGEI